MTKAQTKTVVDQYDSPWKEALEEYFQESMALFFPDIHADIDWSRGYEFLDKELAKVIRQAVTPEQAVDKLVKVYRLTGEETWVLLHIDVQSQHEKHFDIRLYQYNYRLFDRYGYPIITLVIYGDDSKKWRPKSYKRQLWGFRLLMEFPTVKLINYNLEALEQSDNPFAVVVLAHRYTKATKNQPNERFTFKWKLTRMLYERGYSRDKIWSLFRYIDWMMALPPILEKKLDETITQYEEEHKMPFMIYRERQGYERGLEEGREKGLLEGREKGLLEGREKGLLEIARDDVIEVLQIRFGELSPHLITTVKGITDLPRLKTLHRTAITIDSVALFEQFLTHNQADSPCET